jgi:hypothetical protein
LQRTPQSNIGKASGGGVDMSIDYNKYFSKDLWAAFRGNFTYAASRYDYYEEPAYTDAPWRRRTGRKLSQQWGFVAERLFLDEQEVANSPAQFGSYMAGDIKYKDINGDDIINDNDMVPIGFPTTPEINYGFGLSLGYKALDFSCFFAGSARSAFWVSPTATAPFINQRMLLQYYADSHWSENDKDIYSLWPRLSVSAVENNNKTSTWFMYDGSYLRLKTAEVGYTMPTQLFRKTGVASARVYFSGSNLAVWSVFDLWDPEMAGSGVGYPLQRVWNLGLNIEF